MLAVDLALFSSDIDKSLMCICVTRQGKQIRFNIL